ncbi:unnamed protein product (macronuclear) [Paramecium tetraurelia]|uniref:Transmembrane protein n=1 Tax=Paramecium tetraurelia TaxID=5888 RepID=A0D3X2_PARTE|nr:uncharacterized protein GSPATT00013204001 [Paramecium tetraurelia]CAK77739.1 unnamed protein product [Paramecium tetraurelia]|eukprot:XP_001445136.1 hypothetical protein (macronuclear) [Paramecium tetraurelia strain d4-2]
MIRFLSKIDNFGAEFKQRIVNSEQEHKSIIGGIFTLSVYSVCFAYSIFVLSQWASGQILPKILLESTLAAFEKFEMPNELIEITSIRYDDSLIDPFATQGNILMPIAVILENNKPISYQSVLADSETSNYGTNLIEMEQMQIIKNAHNDKTQESCRYYYLLVTACQQQYLKENQTCASEEEIQNYLKNTLVPIELEVKLQQFNTKDKTLYEVEKQLQFTLQQSLTLKAELLFQNTNTVIDDNLIFSNSQSYTYFSDFTVLTQTITKASTNQIVKDDVLIEIAFKVDPIEVKQSVTYVKFGEMLAEVGSIASLLLAASWFIQQFNREEMENKIVDEIISVYYPQFRKLKKVKSCMGKTISIMHEKDQINQEEFQKWYEKVRQSVLLKLSVVNQLHEISRLYFILRSQIPCQQMMKYQNYGIPLPHKLFEKHSNEINNELPSQEMKMEDIEIESSILITTGLCDDDLNILNYKKINIKKE